MGIFNKMAAYNAFGNPRKTNWINAINKMNEVQTPVFDEAPFNGVTPQTGWRALFSTLPNRSNEMKDVDTPTTRPRIVQPDILNQQTAEEPVDLSQEPEQMPVNQNPFAGFVNNQPAENLDYQYNPPSSLEMAMAKRDADFNAPAKNNDRWYKNAGKGVVRGLGNWNGQGGFAGFLGSLVGGASSNLIDPSLDEKIKKQQTLAQDDVEIGRQQQLEDFGTKQRIANANAGWLEARPDIEADKNAQKGRELEERSRANNMRAVASIINRTPDFDPDDPQNADVVEMMNELGLPVLRKDPNKQIRYEQDPETGEMFVISTDRASGQTVAQQINGADGKPLKMATKTALGMKVKELDRTSREAIANARNQTLVNVANIGAGSREKVANINQAGANARNEADNQTRQQIADKSRDYRAKDLMPLLQRHAQKFYRGDIEKAKADFRNAGVNVDEILKRQ